MLSLKLDFAHSREEFARSVKIAIKVTEFYPLSQSSKTEQEITPKVQYFCAPLKLISGPLITCRVICSYMEGVALSRIIDEVYFPMDTLQFGRGGWPSTFKSTDCMCTVPSC